MKISFGIKLLIVAVCALFSIIVAMLTALLVYDPGELRNALLAGGGAFGGCMIMCLTVAAFVLHGHSDP